MKASYSWLRALVPGLTASPVELAARFTAAGLEVEGIEEYGEASRACVVAKVLSKRPHPMKSDLKLVTVDRGGGTLLEVVCGASNVPAAGGLVVLAPLGARLPAKGVTIAPRAIAGVTSEGMLCSESELGLSGGTSPGSPERGPHHGAGEGILVLPPGSAEPGTFLADALPETHDTIYEIGLTPNRPDGLGHIGLAREAATLFRLPWSMPAPGAPARVADETAKTAFQLASVTIHDFERCPRFDAAVVTDVTIAPSPTWLRYRLASLGVRPISNVVDVTNLLLLEYGHPMHAYDLDRVRGDDVHPIVVRRAGEGESLTTLDGVAHVLTADDLVIADGIGAIGLGGVMGGASSEITSDTKHVLLECAYFDPRGVRRASRRHSLHTDASHRFERGVDPSDARDVLTRAVALLTELAGGTAARGEIHVSERPPAPVVATLRAARLDALLGVHVPWDEAKEILTRLGCTIQRSTDGDAQVLVPTHRPDITREVDLIEEVARVRGMDAIPVVLPRVRPAREDAPREASSRQARAAGVELGLSEAITYSFVSRASLEKLGAPTPAVILKNPLSMDQEVMRTSLLPGLLDALSHARRHGERDVRLFTIGSTFLGHGGASGLPEERLMFAAILAGDRAPYLGKPEPVDVWDAKGLAEGFARRMTGRTSIAAVRFAPEELPPHLHPRGAACVTVQGHPVGSLGPLHPDVVERFDLGAGALVLEMDLAALRAEERAIPRYTAIPRFPASVRDLALVVHDDVTAGEVLSAVRHAAGELATEVTLFDRFIGGAIPEGHRSLAFRVVYRAEGRTLTDAEVDAQHAKVVADVGQRFGATLRG
jgi:phenylalanyl-tRNA synthetase beta chain